MVPKHIRESLGISPGDEVDVDLVDGAVRIRRRRALGSLVGIAADGASTADLEQARARERARDRT